MRDASEERLPSVSNPPPLTTVVFEAVHEEGFQASYGRCYVIYVHHSYRFVSRRAAQGIAGLLCHRFGYDGFRLHTLGYIARAREASVLEDGDFPF